MSLQVRVQGQALRFILVGVGAALTHWLCAVLVLRWLDPLLANVVGFGCAFPVSFIGHWRWSFRQQGARGAQALPRFAAVAVSGFAANELLLAGLLRGGWLPAQVALGLSLVLVALATFLLSRHWAFVARH